MELNVIEIGNRLKEIRIKNEMTIREMSKLLNYSISYYNAIEKGKCKLGSLFIHKVSEILNVDYEWLAYGNKNVEIPIYNNDPIISCDDLIFMLKEIRSINSMSQQDMAKKLGYSTVYYNTIENGKAKSLKNKNSLKRILERVKKHFDIEEIEEKKVKLNTKYIGFDFLKYCSFCKQEIKQEDTYILTLKSVENDIGMSWYCCRYCYPELVTTVCKFAEKENESYVKDVEKDICPSGREDTDRED